MRRPRWFVPLGLGIVSLLAVACAQEATVSPTPSSTPRPSATPVAPTPTPDGPLPTIIAQADLGVPAGDAY